MNIMPVKKNLLGFIHICIFLFFSPCNYAQEHQGTANRLIHESSPYLLQHAYNPVDWYPWGEEALVKAKKENIPVIISIGYSSCHWCHVMERESFEDDSVAAFMNKHFVSIKVDREERPDIDQIYIEVAQMMNGSAGWPLNCIVLPDGKPFFAGTYFTKQQWLDLLGKVNDLWDKDRDALVNQANQITQGINENALFQEKKEEGFDTALIESVTQNWLTMFDKKEGGYNRAPKFPMPANLDALLTLYEFNGNPEAREIVTTTLTKMAKGGIYDQIGGGFARYSTDGYWKVPHFEKMLYDNGQLLTVYSKAYQLTKNPLYKQVVRETVDFLVRELRSEEGGFYSSLDADSEGEEGLFYIWEKQELDRLLGDNSPVISDYFQVTKNGNWEKGKNILLVTDNESKILKQYNQSSDSLKIMIDNAKAKMLLERERKTRPGLDDKILTSWNALTIIGLCDAYRAFQNEDYQRLALEAGRFLSQEMIKKDGRVERNFKDRKSSINAFLDDYAFTIAAFLNIYQITFDEKWLFDAKSLANYVINHFGNSNSDYFYFTSDLDPALITRKIDNIDNVISSANSEMAKNLFVLGNYFYDEKFLDRSKMMVQGMSGYIKDHIGSFANWFHVYLLMTHDFFEVAIVGEDYRTLKAETEQVFLPFAILMGGDKEGNLELLQEKLIEGHTYIYVCKDKMCKMPVKEGEKAIQQIKE